MGWTPPGGHEYGTDPVSTSLGHEAVEEDSGGERVEDHSMAVPIEGADGEVPVPDSEGVLDRCSRFSKAGEEPGEERVGLRREGINSEAPSESLGQQRGQVADQLAADRAGHLGYDVAGQAVNPGEGRAGVQAGLRGCAAGSWERLSGEGSTMGECGGGT
jgi:hypothetical protein